MVATLPPIWQLHYVNRTAAAQGTYGPAFSTQIHGHNVVMGRDIIRERLQDAPGVRDQYSCTPFTLLRDKIDTLHTGDRVKGADRVHAREGDDEFILEGDAAANEARVAALGHDGDVAAGAPADDIADLLGGLWLEDGGRATAILSHPVIVVRVELGSSKGGRGERGQDSMRGKNGFEMVDIGRADAAVRASPPQTVSDES